MLEFSHQFSYPRPPHLRPVKSLSLPALYASLMRDEIESFPRAPPAPAPCLACFSGASRRARVVRRGRDESDADEGHWRELLRGLTAEMARQFALVSGGSAQSSGAVATAGAGRLADRL